MLRFIGGDGQEKFGLYLKIYAFDAFSPLEELYKHARVDYNICCLSDVDDVDVKFYQNDMLFGGNSILKEINDDVFPEDSNVVKQL